MLTLEWPWALLLLPLPLLIYFGLPPAGRREESALLVPFYRQVAGFALRPEGRNRVPKGWRLFLLFLIWGLLVVALARPQWVGDPVSLPTAGRDLMLAVDISGSMAQEDMLLDRLQVSRIDLVKKVVGEFLDRRVGDRVGLILFGTEVYIQVPLTFDRQTVKTLLNEALIGFAGKQTSLGDAVALAVKHLKDRPVAGRVLVLLTDGNQTSGSIEPLAAADLAAQTGLKIYTVGVGAEEVVVQTLFGDQRVNPSADLDESTLEKMAAATGGKYFRARNAEELDGIYRAIDRLEPVQQESAIYRPVRTFYHLPLAGALVLSFILALVLAPDILPGFPRRR